MRSLHALPMTLLSESALKKIGKESSLYLAGNLGYRVFDLLKGLFSKASLCESMRFKPFFPGVKFSRSCIRSRNEL